MSEPNRIAEAIEDFFRRGLPLNGTRALVTSGPTEEAIDPVRYIANRSSGKQGHAIAVALARLGAATTLVSGIEHFNGGADLDHLDPHWVGLVAGA